MDDVMVRPRYTRNNASGRKRRRNSKVNSSLADKIIRQIIICLLILVAVGIIKSVDTQATRYLSDKIKSVLFHETDLKSIYQNITGVFDKLRTDKKDKGEDETGDAAIPAGANFSGQDSVNDEDSGYSESADDNTPGDTKVGTEEGAGFIKEKYEFVLPVDGVVICTFGDNTNPTRQINEFHTGIDIEAENGSPIKAALEGEVVLTGTSPAYGKYIKINHGDGLTTLYAHCLNILAEKGQKVKKGDTIAEVGNSGASVGSHLHFEVMKDGEYFNPLDFLKVPVE